MLAAIAAMPESDCALAERLHALTTVSDDGAMWPTAFALTAWTATVEARIAVLARQAVS